MTRVFLAFLYMVGAAVLPTGCGGNDGGSLDRSPAKEIVAFSFAAASNPGLAGDVTATITGSSIEATVPAGTKVSSLVATFTATSNNVTVGGLAQVSGATANDFTAPVVYHVTAANQETRDYTVKVTVAKSSAKELTALSFLAANNAGLAADVVAAINGTAIAATVPFGTDVTALRATFTSTGTAVKVGATDQTSGTTPNNFTAPVTYTVVAADGTTKAYTVTVTIAKSSAKELTALSFLTANNAGLTANVDATINGTAVAATVPFGTDVTALRATFAHTGQSVTVGGVEQASGTTPNNFTAPVTYTVVAADGTTKPYTVTVTIAKSSAKELTSLSFLSANNAGLGADVVATANGTAFTATVPFGTDVTALRATFATTGQTVSIGGVEQVSGVTPNDFSNLVTYRVTAADGTTKDFTVAVAIAKSSAKELTALSFRAASNAGLPADVIATINGTSVAATVPFGTDVTALRATFTATGDSVRVGAATQTSGQTPNNFTSPVVYTVVAADGSTKDFTVTVTIAKSTAKELTALSFLTANNAGLPANVVATISGTTVSATVPFGTDVTALRATFATTGDSVRVGAATQTSGVTPNNFTSPVTYTVVAADGSTKDFAVTVAIAKSTAKELTALSFLSANNAGLAADVVATQNGTAFAATVPFGTDVTALRATFATTGDSVRVGPVVQTSGVTPNNFANPVTYTVVAGDGSTKAFTVTVTIAKSTAKELTALSFLTVNNAGLAANVIATFNGTTVSATVPFGTDVTALRATFATTGDLVRVGATTQTSGVTPNNFTNPVIYTVVAADGSTKAFTVTVTIAKSSAKELTSLSFLTANNPGLPANVIATISGTTVSATVPFGTDVSALRATFATTGDLVRVGATTQTSGVTPNSFTSPVVYTVVAADASTKDFTVTVTIAKSTAKELTALSFLTANNAGLAADVLARVNGTAVAAVVPFGTDVTALRATFATTGDLVRVGAVAQTSGATPNDFTGPVIYTVVAADGSTKDFTVTVTAAPSTAKELTALSFLTVNNAGLAADVVTTLTGTEFTATVPFGTDVTALRATFATTGDKVRVGAVVQTSGVTANNFTNTVTYTVVAADTTTKNFTVTVSIAKSSAKELTALSFQSVNNPGLPDTTAVLNGTTATAHVPTNQDRTRLVATFATSGAIVQVGGVAQVSGVTANDFSAPVVYTIVAADGSTKQFTVTVIADLAVVNAGLRLNELNANLANGCDLVELRVMSDGSLAGMKLLERTGATAAGELSLSFPAFAVRKNDYIVVHFNAGSTTCNPGGATQETQSPTEQPSTSFPGNFDRAFDIWVTDADLDAADNVLTVFDATGAIRDAVFVTNSTTSTAPVSTATKTAAGAVGAANQWSPAKASYTDSELRAIAVDDLDATGAAATGTTIARRDETDDNDRADWTTGAGATATWGGPNPGQLGGPGTGAQISVHTTLGIPSPSSATDYNSYLSVKSQYVMSYNSARKVANWTSWELNSSYIGGAGRQNDFRVDDTLPLDMSQAQPSDYSGSGFDRGHLCPSGDRTASVAANSQTFYLSNMMPQASNNNQGPWEKLETASRGLLSGGRELFVIAGGVYGNNPRTVGNGMVVPDQTFKVVVVLDAVGQGASSVTAATRVIAVLMPNDDALISRSASWQSFRVSVDTIEALTGFDFLSDVDPAIQAIVESRVDNL